MARTETGSWGFFSILYYEVPGCAEAITMNHSISSPRSTRNICWMPFLICVSVHLLYLDSVCSNKDIKTWVFIFKFYTFLPEHSKSERVCLESEIK